MIFLGIKYEPLSEPLIIKICEWGPWGASISLSSSLSILENIFSPEFIGFSHVDQIGYSDPLAWLSRVWVLAIIFMLKKAVSDPFCIII